MTEQAERIKELRKNILNLSQQEFADSLFMKRNSIAQLETGLRNPSERTLKTIAEIHNVNLEWLQKVLDRYPENPRKKKSFPIYLKR